MNKKIIVVAFISMLAIMQMHITKTQPFMRVSTDYCLTYPDDPRCELWLHHGFDSYPWMGRSGIHGPRYRAGYRNGGRHYTGWHCQGARCKAKR